MTRPRYRSRRDVRPGDALLGLVLGVVVTRRYYLDGFWMAVLSCATLLIGYWIGTALANDRAYRKQVRRYEQHRTYDSGGGD